jgi:hypothetical protein
VFLAKVDFTDVALVVAVLVLEYQRAEPRRLFITSRRLALRWLAFETHPFGHEVHLQPKCSRPPRGQSIRTTV